MSGRGRALRKIWLPQWSVGTVSWLLHRVTGVTLAIYLLPHFLTIHKSLGGPAAFDAALATYSGPVYAAAEYVLVAAVTFHLFNGLRLIAVDLFDLSHRQRLLFGLVLAACLAVLLAASLIFVPRILTPVS